MTSASVAHGRRKRPPTKWGDREGRRADILDTARAQIAAGGYLALNMRDLAAGAGVSPGTLYSYFATKEVIFATLYAEAIDRHNDRLAPIVEAPTVLTAFLVDIATAYLDLYGEYGRYFTMWSALQDGNRAEEGPLPADVSDALRAATLRQGHLVRLGLRRAADAEGRHLADETTAVMFIWIVLNGLGDHLTTGRRSLTPFTDPELVALTAASIVDGITTPAPPTPPPGSCGADPHGV